MSLTVSYSKACLEAWLACENLLMGLSLRNTQISLRLARIIDECAQICMGTFHALTSHSRHSGQLALLCVGICEECAELCERYDDSHLLHCADICRQCSTIISPLVEVEEEE